MLTLTRKSGEAIRIGDDVRLVVREVRGRQVRVGVEAPGDVEINREEVYLRKRDERARDPSAVERYLLAKGYGLLERAREAYDEARAHAQAHPDQGMPQKQGILQTLSGYLHNALDTYTALRRQLEERNAMTETLALPPGTLEVVVQRGEHAETVAQTVPMLTEPSWWMLRQSKFFNFSFSSISFINRQFISSSCAEVAKWSNATASRAVPLVGSGVRIPSSAYHEKEHSP